MMAIIFFNKYKCNICIEYFESWFGRNIELVNSILLFIQFIGFNDKIYYHDVQFINSA